MRRCALGRNVCVGTQCLHWDAMCASGGSGMPALRHEVTVYVTALVRQTHATQAAVVADACLYTRSH